ncbi:MAG: 4-hydroxy-tetrahydrodipicolinate synthase [Chloroflexi bacterium]|nr:4-hydroxy-tetrahydrodipicolinate synthase [Chloroflexota bacterium]
MFTGVYTAIVTPFINGELDEESLRGLIEFQITEGIDGIVPCGTTGESPTLSFDEYKRVVGITVEVTRKRIPVVAGAGSNATDKAVELTRCAKQLGVDAVLQVTPYYNKPTPEGLYQHFKKVAEVGLPLVIYNVPGRTGINITPETVAHLSKIPEVAAIKEAGGDIIQIAEISRLCGDRLSLLSGDDAMTLPVLSVGGEGVISVISNLLPGKMAETCRAWRAGDGTSARENHAGLLPLMRAMFMESNPIPIKTALTMKGLIKSAELRLPLCAMSEPNRDKLAQIMKEAGVL